MRGFGEHGQTFAGLFFPKDGRAGGVATVRVWAAAPTGHKGADCCLAGSCRRDHLRPRRQRRQWASLLVTTGEGVRHLMSGMPVFLCWPSTRIYLPAWRPCSVTKPALRLPTVLSTLSEVLLRCAGWSISAAECIRWCCRNLAYHLLPSQPAVPFTWMRLGTRTRLPARLLRLLCARATTAIVHLVTFGCLFFCRHFAVLNQICCLSSVESDAAAADGPMTPEPGCPHGMAGQGS